MCLSSKGEAYLTIAVLERGSIYHYSCPRSGGIFRAHELCESSGAVLL